MEIDNGLQDKLLGLKQARGMLSLHNKCLDNINEQIKAVELEIATAQDREHAELTQQREASEAEYQADLDTKRQELAALVNDDQLDTQTAQEATRTLAAALSRKMNRIDQMARLFTAISRERSAPVCLNRFEVERKMAHRVAAVLSGGLPVQYKGRFGNLILHPGVAKVDDNWTTQDAAAFEKHVAPIITKKETK
jgi:hypothetical protein